MLMLRSDAPAQRTRRPTGPIALFAQAFPTAHPARSTTWLRPVARLALICALLVPAPAALAAGPAVVQLGLFQREGEAWWAWQSLARKSPDLAAGLEPIVSAFDAGRPAGGVTLRATVSAGADPVALCRRMLGAGYGCLVIDSGPRSESAAAQPAPPAPAPTQRFAPLPEVKPEPPPRVAPAVLSETAPAAAPITVAAAIVPVPATSISVTASLAVAAVPPRPTATAPLPAPAAPLAAAPSTVAPSPGLPGAQDGLITYSEEDAKVMAGIERRNRRQGRLGAVLPDTKFDLTPALLTRQGWNLCALTFDDGPHRTVTPRILEILQAEKIRATYFPVAKVALQNPQIIRDFVAAGHEIGNHSLTHSDLRAMAPAGQRHEIAEANRLLREMGANPVLFRPPYGRYNDSLMAEARAEKMNTVLWNVDTRDWKVRDPDKIVQHVKTAAGTGSVLLLHSTYPSTANALPRVIADMRSKGCEFVTLSEWIKRMHQMAEPMLVNASDTRQQASN